MYKKLLQASLTLFLFTEINAQQSNIKIPHRSLLEAKNGQELQAIYEENVKAELAYARDVLGLSTEPQLLPDGTIKQLVGVSQTGMPLYNKTNNAGAAQTIGTNNVYPGGSLGLSLTGSGMTNRLAVWDGGGVRTTHQEFQGRATQMDSPSPTLSDHATHVAGTMIAGGVQANAKGMAFQAPLKCYDWNSDNSEMSSAAGLGMLISNHSYGNLAGWDLDQTENVWKWYGNISASTTEDANFGQYNDRAQSWDQLVYDNPFYLPFKAAGNDRGDYPSGSTPKQFFNVNTGSWENFGSTIPAADGPYDCIATYGTAKNILTVGAVNKITGGWSSASSVVMSSFSGWGPTDDGRIKPDVCAAGVNLTSSFSNSNTAYSTISGTSMATPSASGSALLIQQHFNNLKNRFLRASTLKGLIIHTADEAGTSAGPDYSYGWGLMNTAKAVQTITDSGANNIIESQLNYNSTTPYTKTVVSNGSAPLKITLCWTDRPGNPASGAVDESTKKLINDLDVRLTRLNDNTVYYPYILNPATPNAAATTGDNTRDNVEQIFVNAPSAGTYAVTVSYKGSLAANVNQTFSLIISGITPKPAANFTANKQNICVGAQVTYTNTSVGASSVTWYFPGGTPSTSTATNPVVTYATAGQYAVAIKVVGLSGVDSIYKVNFVRVGGVALPFMETFEPTSGTLNLWTVNNPDGDSTWRLWDNTAGTSPGSFVAGLNNYDNPNTGTRDDLFSPVIDLRGMANANLTFQHAYTRYVTSDRDSLIVSISTDCGNTWTRLIGLTETRPNAGARLATYTGPGNAAQTANSAFIPTKAADWCSSDANSTPCTNINLTPFVGLNNVMIRFNAYYAGGNNIFIDNVNVTGTPFKPKAGFTVPATVCSGQPFSLTDTTINNPLTWEWTVTGPATQTFTGKTPVFTFTQTGFYNVKLKATNSSGADSIIVNNAFEVKQVPTNPLANLTGSLTLCNGDSSLLVTSGTNLQWYKDSIALSGANGLNLVVKDAGRYAVRTMAANGCAAQSNMFTFTTGVKPPVAVISKSLSGNVFCDGGSFTLTSTATANNQWVRNGVDLSGQTGTTLNYNDSGTFTVKVFNGACFSTSLPVTINKLTRPATSEIAPAKQPAYKGDTIVYSVTGTAGSTFNWTVSGGTILNGNLTDAINVKWSTTATNGTVNVTERGSNQCNGLQKTLAVSLLNTGVKNIDAANQFVIYPNPTSSELNIKWNGADAKNVKVSLFDILGKNVANYQFNFIANDEQTIDVSGLSKGIYFLKIDGLNYSSNKRFTKD